MGHEEQIPLTEEEALALLKYMAEHNLHHAQELRGTLSALSGKAAELTENAARLMEKSAELISEAIKETEN